MSTPKTPLSPQSPSEDITTPEVALSQEEYAALFTALDKEALASVLAAVLVTLFFWGSIWLTHSFAISVFHMPLWFVLSCLGGYLVSVFAVVVLVKKYMHNLELKVKSIKRGSDNE